MVIPANPQATPSFQIPVTTIPSLGNYNIIYANLISFPDDGYITSVSTWMTSASPPDASKSYAGATARVAILRVQTEYVTTNDIDAVLVGQSDQQGVVSGVNTFTLTSKIRVSKKKDYLIAIIGKDCNLAWYEDSTNNVGYVLYKSDFAYLGTAGADIGWNYYNVWSNGSFIFAASSHGLRVYTFDGATFTQVAIGDVGSDYYAVWGDGTYIYVTEANGSSVYAYTFDPATNTLTNIANNATGEGITLRGIWGDGTYIYLVDTLSNIFAWTFDGSTFSPITLSNDVSNAECIWVDTTNSRIYVGHDAGIAAYSFDGANFTLLDTTADSTNVHRIFGDDTYIYATSDDGFRVYSWAGGFNPVTSLAGDYQAVWTSDTYTSTKYIFVSRISTATVYAYTFDGTSLTRKYSNFDAMTHYGFFGYGYYLYTGTGSSSVMAYYADIHATHGLPSSEAFVYGGTGNFWLYETALFTQGKPGYFSFEYNYETGTAWLGLTGLLNLSSK